MPVADTYRPLDNARHPLLTLLQRQAGIFSSIATYSANNGEPPILTQVVRAGDVGAIWPAVVGRSANVPQVAGAGTSLDANEALITALAEGLERYATASFREEQCIWASAQELADSALDLDTIPRCSSAELSRAKCPLVLPDKRKPIRWVRGISLLDGSQIWLPAVMVYSYAGYKTQAERFWLPISTGCAAHQCFERAVLNGIFETIERDAISVVWRQMLPLPRLTFDTVPAEMEPLWNHLMRSSCDIDYHFFDATSELGVPTVYGVQMAAYDSRVTNVVACSTDISLPKALAKVIRDLNVCRAGLMPKRVIPSDPADFVDVYHGSTYMARRQNAAAFDFLINSKARRHLTDSSEYPSNPLTALRELISVLRLNRLPVYVADLSTDEAVRVGMRVVRVIVPGLQPLSVRPTAQYLGHPRLYEAPAKMGYRTLGEPDLSSWPQPFA